MAGGMPPGPEVAPAGALALTLAANVRRLASGKKVTFTLTLTNTTSEPLDVPVPNRNWLFGQQLEFEPDVETSSGPHTLKYGYFPGEVHTLAGGASEKVPFLLYRTRDGKEVCVLPPQKSEFADAEGCEQRLTLAAGAASLKVRARFDDEGDWTNLEYPSKRRNGPAQSNVVELKLN